MKRFSVGRVVGCGRSEVLLFALAGLALDGCAEERDSPGFGMGFDLSAGLGDTGDDDDDDDDDNDDDDDDDDDNDDDDEGDDESDDDGDPAEDDGGEPDTDHLAAGIHIDSVVFNQGVAIEVAAAGELLPTPTHNAPVVHGRRTRIQATWLLDADFQPRQLRAALTLAYADGSAETFLHDLDVSGDSGHAPTQPHFEWDLAPEDVRPGVQFALAISELPGVRSHADPTAPPRVPKAGYADLGLDGSSQTIKIVLVPYRSTYAGCNSVPPTDQATLDRLHDIMLAHNPAQDIELTLHAEVLYGQSMADLDPVLTHLAGLRSAEAPGANVYYYGYVQPCETTAQGGLGYVPLDPTAAFEAEYRVAVGAFFDWDIQYSDETMVHEVGHNQGRNHVACSGAEGTTDPGYPHPGGLINGWGFDIRDDTLHPPTSSDYMSYCENYWVSDYTWRNTFETIDALTAMDTAAPPSSGLPALKLVRTEDGELHTVEVRSGTNRSDGRIPVYAEGLFVQWADMRVDHVPDTTAQHMTILVPPDREAADLDVVWTDDGPMLVLAN